MKLMKIMPAAMLLCLSLGAYAQDDDLTDDVAAEDEAVEVFVPTNPTEKKFFHRVQIGFVGTPAKYINNNEEHQARVPDSEKYFLKGVSLGWIGDFRIAKKYPIYFEIGGMLTYRTGRSKGDTEYAYHNLPGDLGEGEYTKRHYRIQSFGVAIPVDVSYQFRNVFGTEGLTLAPYAGLNFRFNVVANRWETKTTTNYFNGQQVGESVTTHTNKSLMDYAEDGGWMEGRTHVGKLLQVGAQVGVNAFWKNYSFGIAYMPDLVPFAKHNSPLGLTSKETANGGHLPMSGTGCDMKITTTHNFAVTVGYVF